MVSHLSRSSHKRHISQGMCMCNLKEITQWVSQMPMYSSRSKVINPKRHMYRWCVCEMNFFQWVSEICFGNKTRTDVRTGGLTFKVTPKPPPQRQAGDVNLPCPNHRCCKLWECSNSYCAVSLDLACWERVRKLGSWILLPCSSYNSSTTATPW